MKLNEIVQLAIQLFSGPEGILLVAIIAVIAGLVTFSGKYLQSLAIALGEKMFPSKSTERIQKETRAAEIGKLKTTWILKKEEKLEELLKLVNGMASKHEDNLKNVQTAIVIGKLNFKELGADLASLETRVQKFNSERQQALGSAAGRRDRKRAADALLAAELAFDRDVRPLIAQINECAAGLIEKIREEAVDA